MTIRLDISERSTVTWCDVCGWSDVCASKTAALRIARDHEREQHPRQRTVTANYSRELARHAT